MNSLNGWKKVFLFTTKQQLKKKSFLTTTLLISILLMIIGIVAISLHSYFGKNDKLDLDTVKDIFIIDDSDYNMETDYSAIGDFNIVSVDKNTITTNNSVTNYAKNLLKNKHNALAIYIHQTDTNIKFDCFLNKDTDINENTANYISNNISTIFYQTLIKNANLTNEQIADFSTPSITSYNEVGKTDTQIAEIIEAILPMAICILLFLYVLLNAETVANEVSIEKTSKLTETLLTCVKPYALIFGKILALFSLSIAQFILWIISIFVGLFGGTIVAKIIDSTYKNPISSFINFIKDNFSTSAFSPSSIVISILFIFIGFLFYSVLAGLAGSIASKPEDLANFKAIYALPISISYMLCMFSVTGSNILNKIIEFLPFSSPLFTPTQVIIGNISLLESISSLSVLIIFSILLVYLSSKLYKGFLMYTGENFSLKKVIGILKTKN